jgi:hypothetical protein
MKNHKCRTYFIITGDFNAKDVLNALEVDNYEVFNKGEEYKISKRKREFDEIKIGFHDNYNVDINEMIRATLKGLINKTDVLKTLKKELSLDYALVLVPEIYSDSEEPKQILSLDRDIIEFLYLTETDIDLDYYVY